ncbi:MAG: DNA repair protein RecO C-terminal domain-containing protein [Paludibacteraceae bacterium]|nr:DNA repair protein RecO C-terminal domain-containing protein [Paludibacteraceae bacterium]
MLSTTDAIVLSLQPHSDKAHILHAYTRAGGRVNYKVYGLGRKHPIGMYMPLSLIQITADYPANGLPTIREAVLQRSGLAAKRSYSETVLQQSGLYKQTVSLFISEVLYHVLRHPMPDEPMYDFIEQAIQALDRTDEPQNFHLQFLVSFAAKLGFAMEKEITEPRTRTERQESLQHLCAYFAEHVETWQNPRSLDVLMEVFD